MSLSSYFHPVTKQFFLLEDSQGTPTGFVKMDQPEEVTSVAAPAKATKSTSSKEGNK